MENAVHYRVHTSTPVVPILSQTNPFCIIILSSTLRSSEFSLPFWVSSQNRCMHFSFLSSLLHAAMYELLHILMQRMPTVTKFNTPISMFEYFTLRKIIKHCTLVSKCVRLLFLCTYHQFLYLSHQRRCREKVSNNRKDFPFQLGDSFEEK